MKIYAKQIPPEHQESPFFLEKEYYENVNIFGNRDYTSHTSALFDALPGMLDELFSVWCDFTDGCPRDYYNSWEDALNDIAPPQGRPEYTREERKHTWPALLEDWNGPRQRTLCRALTLITGREWDSCTLRGCCQGDWQDCAFLVEEWSAAALERLEAEYFNTGTEWIVHDENTAPASVDDINGFSIYCTAWNDDGIKKEIANAAGGRPEDVALYAFDGWTRAAKYKEV